MVELKKALMICRGNISRSPIAEGVFAQAVKERGEECNWVVDSAGLSTEYVGQPPDNRATSTMKAHHIPYNNKARMLTTNDFHQFDFIFTMDEDNMNEVKRRAPVGAKARILLLGDFDPLGDRIIRDPYTQMFSEGFEKCYQQCMRSCPAFLDKLKAGEID